MPCQSGYNDNNCCRNHVREDSEPVIVQRDTKVLEGEIMFYSERLKQMTAVVCAILTECEKKGILEPMISAASENGQIDIKAVWRDHKADDLRKLDADLKNRYSPHELDMIKHLLNNQ